MLCIPHTAKMKIKSSEKDFFKHTNDFQQGANNKKNDSEKKNCKLTVSEFEELQDKILHNFCIQLKSPFFFNNDSLEPQAFIKYAERPPDFLSNTSVC